MVSTRIVWALGAVVTLAQIAIADSVLLPRAPIEAFGIVEDSEEAAANEYAAKFAPAAQFGVKNATSQLLKDRSLELVERQTCNAGYGYCSEFGKCCPDTDRCCPYGYCINPADTCCPDSACPPGWDCCGPNCSPSDGHCCSDYNYCEAGNMCVKLGSTGQIVCCTNLQCTAAVVSGTTSYITQQPTQAGNPTAPVVTTPVASITAAPSATAQATSIDYGDDWYWTVTWWYLSFYWTVIQTSEVTWTTIYETTTFTTTATDRAQALSEFAALSATLSFSVPADAHTSLIHYITAEPSQTDSMPTATGFTFNPGAFSSNTQPSVIVVTKTATPQTTTAPSSSGTAGLGPATTTATKGAGIQTAQLGHMTLIGALVAVPGVLMVWL